LSPFLRSAKIFFLRKKTKEINFNKTAIGLGFHEPKKNENKNVIINNTKEKEKEEISNNYLNTESSNIIGDNNDNNNIFLKRYSKEYFINLFISINCRKVNSELTTPRNKNFFDNKIKRDIGFSWSKNNLRLPKQINSS
jgi:hypothetical protein